MNNSSAILIVEDSHFQAKQIQSLLKSQGYAVSLADNGFEGLRAAKSLHPGIIVSDIVMPVMDGFEMCRAIKNDEDLRHIPIILLTTQAKPADILRGLQAGADSYVTKPFDKSLLLSTIQAMFCLCAVPLEDRPDGDSHLMLEGRTLPIKADRQQMLNFFISAYKDSYLQNQRLEKARRELALLNQELEKLVSERTAELRAEVEMRQKAQAKLHRLAVTDGLTRLYNYRYFMDSCRKEFDRYKRYKRPLALITIDVDHFKSVNDTYGHEAGDTALCALAGIVRKSFRNVDITARIGGEEFAVLLPETTIERAYSAAERLRRNVAATTVKYHEHTISLTISSGVAACADETSDFKELIAWADSALYVAKKHGRNKVEQYRQRLY